MHSPSAPGIRHDLVLVGGGHAHIQVLKRWAMSPVPGTRLTLVVDRPIAVYSGMVPGFLAGHRRMGAELRHQFLDTEGQAAAHPALAPT